MSHRNANTSNPRVPRHAHHVREKGRRDGNRHDAAGERKPARLTREQQLLVEDNIALVGYALHRYGHQGLDYGDDTFQIGVIGLIRAAASYDAARGSAFSSYAIPCILNELRREARKQRRWQHRIILSLDMPLTEDRSITLRDVLASEEPPIDARIVDLDLTGQMLQLLRCKETTAARMTLDYLTTEDSQREVARRYGVSQASASNNIRKTLRWLRKQCHVQEMER